MDIKQMIECEEHGKYVGCRLSEIEFYAFKPMTRFRIIFRAMRGESILYALLFVFFGPTHGLLPFYYEGTSNNIHMLLTKKEIEYLEAMKK